MNTYSLYGTALRSAEPFPELTPSWAPTGWQFSRGELAPPADARWRAIWRLADGTPWLSVARDNDDWWFSFTETAVYRATPGRRSVVGLASDAPPSTVRHLLIDQVMPLLLSVEHVVLHASAAAVDGRAVAFIAHGGLGKSTLALHLARLGVPVLADDALVVLHDEQGRPTAQPSYPGLRLWPDALTAAESAEGAPLAPYTDKKRLVAGLPFYSQPLPLDAVYVVERGPHSSVDITPLRPAALLTNVLSQAFRLDAEDRTAHRRHFDRLAHTSGRTRGWILRVPDDLGAARTAAGRVLEHVRRLAAVVQ